MSSEEKQLEKTWWKPKGCLGWFLVLFIVLPIAIAAWPITLIIIAWKLLSKISPKKRKVILLSGLGVFTLLIIVGALLPPLPSKDNDIKDNGSATPQKEISLVDKVRSRNLKDGDSQVIQGVEAKVGETADSIFDKFNSQGIKSTKTIKETDKQYGLIVQHTYQDYSLLFIRELEGKKYFILWDIYPNSEAVTTSSTQPSEDINEECSLNAKVSYSDVQLEVANLSNIDWYDVKIEINSGIIRGGYSYKAPVIKAGTKYTIGLAKFSDSKGNRFSPFEKVVQNIYIVDNTTLCDFFAEVK